MMRITFIVPVHGREDLTRVCLRQLRRTCDALASDIHATAVVIGEGDLIDFAYDLGFSVVERENGHPHPHLGRKFNDGMQAACDPEINPSPADFVVPCGSDDWIDPVVFRRLPGPSAIGIFRRMSFVDEDRTRLARIPKIHYKTAAGPKIIPRQLLALAYQAKGKPTPYRPAEEARGRNIDASTIEGIKRGLGHWPNMVELDVHDLQIVDWKSHGEQLNSYRMICGHRESEEPFAALGEFYPPEAIEEMRALAGANSCYQDVAA